MKKGNSYVGYQEINQFVLEDFANNPTHDYIYYFTAQDSKKTSITIEFEKPDHGSYFGLNPGINTDDIYEALLKKESHFSSREAIYDFAKSLGDDLWQAPKDEKYKDLDIDFAVKCLLSMGQFFYIDLKLSSLENPQAFLDILDSQNNNQTEYRFSFYDVLDNENVLSDSASKLDKIRVYGRLPESIINALDENLYSYIVETNMIIIQDHDKGQSFKTLYEQKAFRHLQCTSEFFYNGVNIRLKQVEIEKPSVANNSAQVINLKVERTTFGTICGFDGRTLGKSTQQENNVIGHPFLSHCREKLLKIAHNESKLISELLSTLNDQPLNEIQSIQVFNHFLDQSIYPHYINISGNLVTSDGYCIYTKRNESVTDAGSLYCSVNGVSEVHDPLVKHYRRTDSDRPTIQYQLGEDTQTFDGELDRECQCELNINDPALWTYYGFSLIGKFIDGKPITNHINVMATKTVNIPFEQIKTAWLTASERHENKQLFGYRLQVHLGWLKAFASNIIRVILILMNSKDVIGIVLSFLGSLIGWGILTQGFQFSKIDLSSITFTLPNVLNSLVSLVFVILSVKTLWSEFKGRKTRPTIFLWVSPAFGMERYLRKILKKKLNHSHPIIHIMTALHINDKISQKIESV